MFWDELLSSHEGKDDGYQFHSACVMVVSWIKRELKKTVELSQLWIILIKDYEVTKRPYPGLCPDYEPSTIGQAIELHD